MQHSAPASVGPARPRTCRAMFRCWQWTSRPASMAEPAVLRRAPWRATATITFAALKSGLLLGHGPEFCGRVEVADIGLSVEAEVGTGDHLTRALITNGDVGRCWPRRPADAHKWMSAVWIIGGAPGMTGAAALTAEAAGRAGAGYVLVSAPPTVGSRSSTDDGRDVARAVTCPAHRFPVETVVRSLAATGGVDGWPHTVADEQRVGALVIGNGLGCGTLVLDGVVRLLALSDAAVVLDADALEARVEPGCSMHAHIDVPPPCSPHTTVNMRH